jgi:nicotinamidase-related amidase
MKSTTQKRDLDKLNFKLSTEQYEVLIAFEDGSNLADVAAQVKRDPSVVSRTLKAISEVAPLLEKRDGKWRITPLGRQFNKLTKNYIEAQCKLIDQNSTLRLARGDLPLSNSTTALLLLGVQLGFQSFAWGARCNPDAEIRIERLLSRWRSRSLPVFYGQHLSKEKNSPLLQGTRGSTFIESLKPLDGEIVIAKEWNSAFFKTNLDKQLRERKIDNIVLAGFSTCHCIDATARSAFDLGYSVYLVSDATAAFDRIGPDGKTLKAETLHSATLAILHQEYGIVINSEDLLESISSSGVELPDV